MLHKISSNNMTALIDEQGAELRSLQYQGHEYLWQGDPAYWDGQSPLLFPYVGRFTDGKYCLHGKEYELPIHGFAKDSHFTVLEGPDGNASDGNASDGDASDGNASGGAQESSADQPAGSSITFVLEDSDVTRAVYPYKFRLTVTYTIGEADLAGGAYTAGCTDAAGAPAQDTSTAPATLSVTYRVENLSNETMYFGLGGHPAFQVPLEDGLDFEDYKLVFSTAHKPSRVGHTPTCFLSGIDQPYPLEHGTDLPLHHDLFDDDAIVLKDVADTVTLCSDHGARSVTMHYPHLPYLGLWHMPKTDAPYICIEPWTSLPSRQDIVEDFACKSDLIRLCPGGCYENGWQATLR